MITTEENRIGYPSSIENGKRQFSSIYITYTLLMQAQDALNEEPLDDGQAAEVLLIWTRMSYLIEQQ